MTGEAAREHHIYVLGPDQCAQPLLDNQVLLVGQQFERIMRFQRHDFEVALLATRRWCSRLLYCEGQPYYDALAKDDQIAEPALRDLQRHHPPDAGNIRPGEPCTATEKPKHGRYRQDGGQAFRATSSGWK